MGRLGFAKAPLMALNGRYRTPVLLLIVNCMPSGSL